MAYSRVNWQNSPSTSTPINATNLNNMDAGIKANDDKLLGTAPAGNMVVDSIRSKNMLNINMFAKGRINETTGNPEYPERVSTLTIGSNSVLITTTQSWSGIHTAEYIGVDENETYNLNFTTTTASSSWGGLVCYDSSLSYLGEATKTTVSSSTNASYNFTLLANTKYVRVVLQNTTATTITYSNLQLEKGTQKTTYYPYQNITGQEIYSSNETIVGKWINGKPIYRKVLTPTISAQITYVQHNITNPDVLVNAHGSFRRTSSLAIRNLIGGTYPNWESSLYDFNATTFTLWFSNNQINAGISECVVVLEYTKTTD